MKACNHLQHESLTVMLLLMSTSWPWLMHSTQMVNSFSTVVPQIADWLWRSFMQLLATLLYGNARCRWGVAGCSRWDAACVAM